MTINTHRLNKKRTNSAEKLDIYKFNSYRNFNDIHNNSDSNNTFEKRELDEARYKYFFFKEHLENDELNGFKSSLTTYNVIENEINFLPTYKYMKGNNYYDLDKRLPGWTDRILYKNNESVKCIKYDKINIKISDHRPVFGLFEINI